MAVFKFRKAIGALSISTLTLTAWSAGDLPTKFSNFGSISNTRHNLSQSTIGGGSVVMDPYRNDYGAVCVYCHTPHGGNTQIEAPLWNRTFNDNTYVTYDTLRTSSITSPITQPGVNSLTCLSCHDGTLAVDSILNMPGSGRYSPSETSQNNDFLNGWSNPSGADVGVHMGLNKTECLTCHAPGTEAGATATDFTAFALGTDLTNDHPIGILLPVNRVGDDFNDPAASSPGLRYYDNDGDERADKDEIRFYDTGEGPEVECASCHDPHGVESLGSGSQFNPTFLRVSNNASAVCQTCHNK
ncbi:MAG: hypothetical protein V7752_04370 [Halopseudomonas sp.]